MGIFSRKSKKNKSNNKKGKQASSADSVSLLTNPQDETRQDVRMVNEPPIRTFDTLKKQVTEDESIQGVQPSYSKGNVPPPAREAAFHGPPRFDWMDIVSRSTVKPTTTITIKSTRV